MSATSWDKLADVYQNEGIVLVLGAGISRTCGFPSWEELIERLALHCHGEIGIDQVYRMLAHDYSLPTIAGLIASSYTRQHGEALFVEQLRDALYEGLPVRFYRQELTPERQADFVDYIQQINATLRTIAALCAVPEPDGSFEMNPRIHAAATFNLDALLHNYVRARYGRRLLRIIDRASANNLPGNINLYHVHGYLRFDTSAGKSEMESVDDILLTEQQYFDFFNRPTSIFSYTALYLMREYANVFVGLSMQDNNLRRLLHYSKVERAQGLIREGRSTLIDTETQRHFAVMLREDPVFDGLIEDSLEPLGVNVLWIDAFSEIPQRFAEVYGPDWAQVF